MCGICGIAWTDPRWSPEPAVLDRMTDTLAHRGPWHGERAALGFRRLAIIDLVTGQQPMSNEDGSIWIVFNGEVYNFRSLRQRLEGLKHRFRTRSDTEVILHLYEEEGPECVQRLRGMFAFALWDCNERRLLLARDRLGVKPLVYRHEPDRIIFASELKAILQAPDVPRELDPDSLDHYLTYQYVPHPRTIFRGIGKLPPAHIALWQDGQLELRRYWQVPTEPPGRELDLTAFGRQLRQKLSEATQLRMISEVPLGAFLSGGIDSTITVGLMQEVSREPVKTFTIAFPVREFNESDYARIAAKHLGTDHHELTVQPSSTQVLPQLVWHYDEPFADSSAIPTWYLAQMTSEHVTVALTGDAGDELFAGYPRYRAVRLAEYFDRLPTWAKWAIANPAWQRLPASVRQKSKLRQLKKLLAHLAQPPQERYADWICIFNLQARSELYSHDFITALTDDPIEWLRSAYRLCPDGDMVTRTCIVDLLTYLPCDLLTKVDIASMAHGLECRSPFFDHHVVELSATAPIQWKMRQLKGKYVLKRVFADLLPQRIRNRPKMGFGVPIDRWFRVELADYLRHVLLDNHTLSRSYFEPAAVRKLVEDHIAGRWDHSYRLWALLIFELWHRLYLDPAVPPQRAPRTV